MRFRARRKIKMFDLGIIRRPPEYNTARISQRISFSPLKQKPTNAVSPSILLVVITVSVVRGAKYYY